MSENPHQHKVNQSSNGSFVDMTHYDNLAVINMNIKVNQSSEVELLDMTHYDNLAAINMNIRFAT